MATEVIWLLWINFSGNFVILNLDIDKMLKNKNPSVLGCI